MRNISFAMTTGQIQDRSKTVTRRLGWRWLAAGPDALLQPVVKSQGLRKGEKVQKIGGPIRVVAVREEPLHWINRVDVIAEGFPGLTPAEFVVMFCEANGCKPSDLVTRIEFEYVEAGQS